MINLIGCDLDPMLQACHYCKDICHLESPVMALLKYKITKEFKNIFKGIKKNLFSIILLILAWQYYSVRHHRVCWGVLLNVMRILLADSKVLPNVLACTFQISRKKISSIYICTRVCV